MKLKWKILSSIVSSSIACTTIVVGLSFQHKSASNLNVIDLSKNVNKNTRALIEGDVNAKWKYTSIDKNNVSWFGTKKPDKADPKEIKDLITFYVTKNGKDYPNSTANIVIELEKIESKHLSGGYVDFKVKQIKSDLGNQSNPSTERYIDAPSGSGNGKVWNTQKFNGLFISTKFNFEWRDQKEIAEFLKSTDKTVDDLTIDDVLLNFVKKGDGYELPDKSKISLKKEPLISSNSNIEKEFGTTNIEIEFKGINNNEWLNNVAPNASKLKKQIRGLATTNNKKREMFLETKTTNEISNTTIDKSKTNIFNDYLLSNESKLANLFPSEFSNLSIKNKNIINDMFIKGNYLSDKKPLTELKYFDINVTDPNFTSKTGVQSDSIGIKNIELIPDDINGSIQFKYDYTYFDVYMNQVSTETGIKILNSQEEEFKKNPDAGKILKFSWKDDDSLVNVPSINDILSDYNDAKKITRDNSNVDDIYNNKLKALSNQFFDATNDVYSKNRDVKIEKKSNNSIEITLLFDTWSGGMYDEGNNKVEGFKTSKTFEIKNSGITGLTWNSQKDIESKIPNMSSLSVKDIGNKLYNKELNMDIFVSGIGNANVIFDASPVTGSLTITVSDGNNSSSRIFTGFKKENTNTIDQFSWIPEEEIPQELLAIDLNDITPQIVIDNYLKKINYFKNSNISENQVKLTKNLETKSLLVDVEVDKFNQDIPNSSKKFSIELRGFIVTNIKDGNSYKAPKDLTIVLSVLFAIVISATLIGVLIWIIVKKVKISKSKRK